MGIHVSYRIWDEEEKAYKSENIFLAPDGYLYQLVQDDEPRQLSAQRYQVEFATGYLDTNDVMIYDGDRVKVSMRGEEVYTVAWGEFDDCCVKGQAWILEPDGYEPCLGFWCDNEEKEFRYVTIVGNKHDGQDG